MKEPPPMKLYVTYGSPYARLARMVVVEKGLEGRVEILEAKTRTAGSPYYQINPSGRVPYLVDDAGIGMEDSQLICAYLDSLDGKPASTTHCGSPIGPTADWKLTRAACAKASAYGCVR
jgi:glutathione S-transferase